MTGAAGGGCCCRGCWDRCSCLPVSGLPKLGAAATISIPVASQLCMGLLVDVYRAGPAALRENLPALFGALLLVAGAYLVAKRSFDGG